MSNKDIAYDKDDANYKKIKFHIPLLSNAGITTTISTDDDNYDYLQGDLSIPYSSAAAAAADLKSLVIFAHGSSSSRKSIRNRYVSHILNNNGFATLLTDLLTTNEVNSDTKNQKIMDKDREEYHGTLNKFNIHLLSGRLTTITKWVIENISEVKGLPIGYFGRSTGVAAAIESAVDNEMSNLNSPSHIIYAIVSRGGRPDLADSSALKNLKAATLLIVGEKDSKETIELNRQALQQLTNSKSKEMMVIPEASHLFDNNESMIEEVANITSEWFSKNIGHE